MNVTFCLAVKENNTQKHPSWDEFLMVIVGRKDNFSVCVFFVSYPFSRSNLNGQLLGSKYHM